MDPGTTLAVLGRVRTTCSGTELAALDEAIACVKSVHNMASDLAEAQEGASAETFAPAPITRIAAEEDEA